MKIKDMKLVKDVNEYFGVDEFSINYGGSRIINHDRNRKVVCYSLGPSGGLFIFEKKGGYIAYYIRRDSFNYYHYSYSRAEHMDLEKAYKIIKYWSVISPNASKFDKQIESELKSHLFMKKL